MEVLYGLLLLFVLLPNSLSNGVYEIIDDNSCTVIATQGDNVDILCTLPTDRCTNQSTAVITWLFASTGYRIEIEDSDDKYGIWDELKSDTSTISSLLRVRGADKNRDVGIYTCRLSCEANSKLDISRAMEICVQDSATNLISCDLSTTEPICTHVFDNGVCNEHCDTEDQLFDGGDCDSYRDELCTTAGCTNSYNNDFCDHNCSSSQCGYDGGDCLRMTQSITREQIAIIIPTAYHTSIFVKHLSRQISTMLATLVELHGKATSWSPTDSKGIQATYINPAVFKIARNNLTMLQLKLTPQSCVSDRGCFLRVRSAAKYISHHLIKDSTAINSSIAAIGIASMVDECSRRDQNEAPVSSNGESETKKRREKTNADSKKRSLTPSEIAGIALCAVSIVLLVLGILVACRYRAIANSRQLTRVNKQSQVKAYIDSIPVDVDMSSEGSSSIETSKSPHSSIARSVTSKETILLRDVTNTVDIAHDIIHTSQA